MVNLNLSRQHRSLVAKLLCGILPLEVEVGRFQGAQHEDHHCRVCGEKATEDEYHFIFKCKKLKSCRKSIPIRLKQAVRGLKQPMDKLQKWLKQEYMRSFASYLDMLCEARQGELYR